ncbi:hypothetical protein Acr_05g0015960 [Actinidia rufa]|uniref:Retrovirus-related Pol polyprotein from transposon TNT 1-94-like beta-barrel domain-containing protein n=1 Tax=Actinidia rufa TaxID=165716 RepID=A0A7J0EQV2_9ERIC|nr:hypothetical protein Acr_05g0015960 [Actinidia rufa]
MVVTGASSFIPSFVRLSSGIKEKSKASPRTAAALFLRHLLWVPCCAPTAPDLHQLQTQFQNPNGTTSVANFKPRADDHMTGELSLFTSHLSSIDQFVRIADGSAVHVRSKGEICLSSQLTLSSVLYIPDFAYNLLSNGVAERKNRSIMTVVRCLLCGMHVPKHFWDMAVLTATYLLNRTPSRILLGTPHSLNPRQGEAPEDPSIFSRPVPLFESPQVASPTLPPVLTSDPRHMYSRRPPASDPLPQSSPESDNISPISSPVRRYPTRDRRPPDKLCFSNPNATKHSIAQYVSYQGLSDSYRTFIGHVSSTPIPRSVSEALRDPNWVTAMQMLIMLVLKLIAALLQVSVPSVALTFYLGRVRNKQWFLGLLLKPNIGQWPKVLVSLCGFVPY